MLPLEVGQKSHIGRSRKLNQDSYAVLDSSELGGGAGALLVVADGMGRAGGEVASQVTVQMVCKVAREILLEEQNHSSPNLLGRAIGEAVTAANLAVWNQSRANPELRGMGTTCVAVLIRDNHAAICNVGDSRIYLLRHGEMVQLTSDHSLVHEYVLAGDLSAEQARTSRYKNVITRAIGIANQVAPDVEMVTLLDGDTLLLCSDGLTNMLTDTDIARILAASPTADSACEELVNAANESGGIDNITTVVVRCGRFVPTEMATSHQTEPNPSEYRDSSRVGRRSSLAGWIPALFALVLMVGGLAFYFGGGWDQLTAKWRTQPIKSPARPAAIPRLDYEVPRFVTTKPLLGYPLSCDGSGTLIARTTGGKLVRIGKDGAILGTYGNLAPPIEPPAAVHMKTDAGGNLYVSLRKEKVIYKYDPTGKRVAEIGSKSLVGPEDIAIDKDGNLYVIDDGRLKVCAVKEIGAESGAASTAQPSSRSGERGKSHAP